MILGFPAFFTACYLFLWMPDNTLPRERLAQQHFSDSTSLADALLRFPRKRNLRATAATKQHDGQITKSLSSPSRKDIPLPPSAKSLLEFPPSCQIFRTQGALAIVADVGAGSGGRGGTQDERAEAYGEVVWA
jgi:hypothetical protein